MFVMDRLCKRWVKLVASLLATDRDLMRFDTAGKKSLDIFAAEGGEGGSSWFLGEWTERLGEGHE